MNQQFAQRDTRSSCPAAALVESVQGAVQHVDTVSRELTVLLSTGLVVFDVASDCPIYLRGERIKLRLVQPRDQVRVLFLHNDNLLISQRIDVLSHGAIHVVKNAV